MASSFCNNDRETLGKEEIPIDVATFYCKKRSKSISPKNCSKSNCLRERIEANIRMREDLPLPVMEGLDTLVAKTKAPPTHIQPDPYGLKFILQHFYFFFLENMFCKAK
ncbi:hypothetical protein G4B88_025089 [Cannabis sativa]|uniref:Uncharacterized protein n=1 Tax=Cannabis sativa TaxID=3483 RepID=A0A7J6EFS0_CANSA|nr:hypothetical protein G4B88_025089 [Cannabis sativa]